MRIYNCTLCLLSYVLILNLSNLDAQVAPVELPCFPQTGIQEVFDIPQQTWNTEWRTNYQYNNNGVLLEKVVEEWDNGAYTPYGRTTYSYAGIDTVTTDELWDGNAYVPNTRRSVYFDSLGNPIEVLDEEYTGSNWTTTSSFLFTRTYDSLGREVSLEYDVYFMGVYLGLLREYIYGAAGVPDTINWSQRTGIFWEPSFRFVDITWHSFPDYQFAEYTRDEYYFGIYSPFEKYIYNYYPPAGSYELTRQLRNGSNWISHRIETLEYDAEERPTLMEYLEWVNMAWQVNSRKNLTYQVDGQNCLTEIHQTWVTPTDSIINQILFSNNFVGISEVAEPVELKVYPNPARDHINLRVNTEHPETANIEIYDLKGQLQLRQVSSLAAGHSELKLDIDLPLGMYLLHLRINEDTVLKRLVIGK